MLKTIDVSHSREFALIKGLVETNLIKAFDIDEVQDLCKFGQSEIDSSKIDFRNDTSLMLRLEILAKKILLNNSIYYEFIQFPFNLRILLPVKSQSYGELDFNVDTIHCDQWSGAPVDSSNVFLYVCKPECAPELAFYDYEEHYTSIIRKYKGPYKTFSGATFTAKQTTSSMPGTMHIFNDYQAHSVKREGSGVTISLDFRMRPLSKYFLKDLYSQDSHQIWTASKMTSLGVYWRWILESYPEIFEEKINDELLDNKEAWFQPYKSLRLDYIKNHYNEVP